MRIIHVDYIKFGEWYRRIKVTSYLTKLTIINIHFFPALLSHWHITYVCLRYDDFMHVYTAMVIVHTSAPSHNYLLCVYVWLLVTLKIYSLNNFQVYSTVLLAIITMQCTRCPELIHLKDESLYLWRSSPHIPFSPPDNHHSGLWVYEFSFLDSICKWEHMVFVFLTYFS